MQVHPFSSAVLADPKNHDERIFERCFDHMPVSMVITDAATNDNLIVFANKAFHRLTGYSPSEVIGKNCRFLQGAGTDRRHSLLIRDAIVNDEELQIDILNYRKDGKAFWNALYLSPILDDDGVVRFYCASQIDVTDRVEHSNKISDHNMIIREEVRGQAQALEDLKAGEVVLNNAVRQKSEFVANMSHELRTPLTGILGLHDLLRADPTLDARQRRYLTMAHEAGSSLLSIVNDILDFSKIEAGELSIERSPFEVLPLVESCEDLIAESALVKGVDIVVAQCDEHLTVNGDAARIRQVLLNLMSNAVKFMERGTVSIVTSLSDDKRRLKLEVSDTGIGISDDQLPLLFKRFSQADASITRRFGGTGLGLAICDRLVDLMGGKIGVTSKYGCGSTFWFEIPVEVIEARVISVIDMPSQILPPKRILLAEDNLVNQEIVKSMLEARGHSVTLVDNGAAAAAAATKGDHPFDLILMDLQMPIMDGLSATKVIRKSECTAERVATPIIALTANAMSAEVFKCLEAGMDRHIAKPIKWRELFEAMTDLCESTRP